MLPTFTGIDHIHYYVPNKEAAASWFQEKLGFRITKALTLWSNGSHGPLTIEDATGKIHLALFQREDYEPSDAIAFGVDGEGFLQWKKYLTEQAIKTRLANHTITWSLYFSDPFGHQLEITTSEVEKVNQYVKLDNSERYRIR